MHEDTHSYESTARSNLAKCTAGVLLSIVVVLLQYLLVREFPIHFAPSLLSVCVLTWYLGPIVGAVAVASAALAVNYLLLNPHVGWSLHKTDVFATLAYLLLASLALMAISSLRSALGRLEADLEKAQLSAAMEGARRKSAESEFADKLRLLDHEIASLSKYVESYEHSKRFARRAQSRLAELRAAIEEFPLPVAIIADENGLPVIRFASNSFFEISNQPRSAPAIDVFDCILTRNRQRFADNEHPVTRALRGESITEQVIIGGCFDEHHQVELYAKSVAEGRLLAVAIISPVAFAVQDRHLSNT